MAMKPLTQIGWVSPVPERPDVHQHDWSFWHSRAVRAAVKERHAKCVPVYVKGSWR